MHYYIVGLGNPGEGYEKSRHNTGRMAVERFRKKHDFEPFFEDKKKRADVSLGKFGKKTVTLVSPLSYMNTSGKVVGGFVKNMKAAERLIVVYDDLALPLGTFKISFGRSAGGHKGVDSVIRALKTKNFIRVRVGISPVTPSGKLKKPTGKKSEDYVIGNFRPKEFEKVKKVFPKIVRALERIVREGRAAAMNEFN